MTELEQDQTGSHDVPTDASTAESDSFAEIGQHCAFDFVPEPHYMKDEVWIPDEYDEAANSERDLSPLSEEARGALMRLDYILSKADIAPRRIEVEQAWKGIHYDRGYQFLLKHRNGGWTIPATGTGFGPTDQKANSQFYQTNIYAEKGQVITAALAREVPKVQFFPANPDYAPDQDMAEVADDLRAIWAKNNDLQRVLRDAAKIFWTEDRCVFWTRYEINGDEFGYEDPEEPTVPEDELQPPAMGTGTSEDTQYQEANKSVLSGPRKPRGRVRTTALGKLDTKVPIYVDERFQMNGVILYEDKDIAVVKAQFPWMKDKIHGGGDGEGETELDRIARENVRQAVPGQYVTGDSINRHCVVKHSYIRQSMFYDIEVKDEVRQELLEKFPDGCCLVKAATEFVFARNECLDDHIVVGHPFPGKGQNRLALGESLLPIQDYLNELVSLALDFAKRTVPKKWMDAEAFNIEALRTQTNVPGSIGPFQRQPGVPVSELIFVEPTPQPQNYLFTYIQWLVTSVSEQISGAMPSLFGAAITGQVGSEGVAIQRDQALQRMGGPWNALQSMFAESGRQAAMLTACCANKDINDVVPGRGRISINLNKLKGRVLCYPESNPEFPESWAQKETRVMELVDSALSAPNAPLSQMILDPRNLKAIQSAVRLPDFVIKGAASVDKQEGELEILLRSGPVPNPQKLKMQQAMAEAQEGLKGLVGKVALGQPLSPEEQQQSQAAPALMAQMQQQISQLPDLISTVAVREDASEDHDVEAAVLFDWMNGANGRKFQHGSPQQQAAFQNVYLHWQKHMEVSAKLKSAAQSALQKPPSISVATDKMPPQIQAEIIQAAGLPASPDAFQLHNTQQMNREIAKKVVPDQIYTSNLHKPGAEQTGTPRKMRR